jgi:hypothetical protein
MGAQISFIWSKLEGRRHVLNLAHGVAKGLRFIIVMNSSIVAVSGRE